MKSAGVLDKTRLVFGQMNESPGARMRVALSENFTMVNILEISKTKMFYYLLIIFLDLLKLVQKFLLY
ncbi:hypothetical protein [Mycoplasmopsis cynos]|uniref:hypothetical protein n=1 Tax=Mycoplasmopsis cynos TaxID=171284 RepID=UPI0024C65838|nr:hypothetical protein [Mycoplasmopsis cynos]WAM05241.1 hypothetical protein ONA01_06025 [Mycoplasmopsis cynos]